MVDKLTTFYRNSRSYIENHPEEIPSIIEEHIDRLNMGKGAWNKWDAKFKEYIKEFEVKDALIHLSQTKLNLKNLEGYNFSSDVDFSLSQFERKIDFSDTKFNGNVDFQSVVFNKEANLLNAEFNGNVFFNFAVFKENVFFNRVCFRYDVSFQEATFNKIVDFQKALFKANAKFRKTKFMSNTYFINTIFKINASFHYSSFHGTSSFQDAIFNSEVSFIRCNFEEHVNFFKTQFHGNSNFLRSNFQDTTSFFEVAFNATANFRNSSFDSLILANVKFLNNVPDFSQTKFTTPVSLSSTYIPDLGNRPINNVTKYRNLKAMAIASHDHEKEIKIFGYEVKAKRGVENSALDSVPGYLYQWFSNFGQSIWKPIMIVCCTWFIAYILNTGNLYYFDFPKVERNCPNFGQQLEKFREYSFHYTCINVIPFYSSSGKSNEKIIRCLFNDDVIPIKYKIIELIHKIITLIGLFLLGLALRNKFKIS